MIDSVLRDLQVLRKADFLIARIWLDIIARRLALFVFAALIAVFGLGMANLAGFYALQASVGAVWAAAIVAVIDLLVALVVLLVGRSSRPGPEIDLAFDVHKMALESLQMNGRDLKLTLGTVGQELTNVKSAVTQLVQNPMDVAAQKLLVPAVLSILRGLRSKGEHT
jgi:hypothetical protein